MDPLCGTPCGSATVQPHVEVAETKPEMTGASGAVFRAPSSELMLEQLENAMMMSKRPEQLATLEELEKAIVDSRSATSQLNISVNNVLREAQELAPGSPVVVDPMVPRPLTHTETRELLRGIPLEDGTLLHKIFADQTRRASDIKFPTKDDSCYSWMIVGHQWFELLISLAIMVNSVMLGVESQMSLTHTREDLAWARIAEGCFLAIFTVEILLRLIARGWRVLKDGWFLFDSTLVIIAFVEQFIELFSNGKGSGYEQQVLVLRTTRLFRLIRTFRMIKQIRSVWRLVYGLITCGETITSTFILLLIVLYVFGVMGLQLRDHTGSLPLAMMTLVRFDAWPNLASFFSYNRLDSVDSYITGCHLQSKLLMRLNNFDTFLILFVIGAPLIKEKALVLGLYFGLLICDGSGEVDLKEMAKFGEDGLVPDRLFEKASVDSMSDLFDNLDVDGSGVITRYEFIEGLLNLFLRDVPVSAQMTMKMIRQVRADVSRLQTNLQELDKTDEIKVALDNLQEMLADNPPIPTVAIACIPTLYLRGGAPTRARQAAAQPHIEVTEIKPEMAGASGAVFRAPSSEVMLEQLDHAMMMSKRPEQLVRNLKIQQSVLEATLEELEKAIVDSRSATSQLNISVNKALREVQEVSPDPIAIDPKVPGPLPHVETRELLRDIPLEDGTMLHKIFGHKPRRAIIVGHPWFELLISVAIMVNSVMLGVESQMSLTRNEEDLAWIAEVCFLAIFTVEILLRLAARGWRVIKDGWFLFDSTLVIIAYIEQFVELFSDGGDSGYAQQVLVLRTTRLFRLIRTFRMIKQIRSIWRLVYGLFTCCETIISTFMLLFIVLYVFGVMGLRLELITKDAELRKDPEIDALVVDSFSTIPLAMMTLVRFDAWPHLASSFFLQSS
eukprot:s3100_g9.t1